MIFHRIPTAVLSLLCLVSRLAAADAPKPAGHTVREIEGWRVRVDNRLLAGPGAALGTRALDSLERRLSDIGAVVPQPALGKLRTFGIVLDLGHGGLTNMQYHPDAGWLAKHGYATDLARCVHIPVAAQLLEPRQINVQPWCVLHELAHAYHDQVLGFGDGRIIAAHRAFAESGRGDKALLITGGRARHYGLTDPKEFFAEMTEAYFGSNDFFPFNRGELMTAEPEVFRLVGGLWGAPDGDR